MALETISQTSHHAIDRMSSGHLEMPVRPSTAKMMQDFNDCVRDLTALKDLPLPLHASDMHKLNQLNAKSAELEGHLNNILRENNFTLPGVPPEQTQQILDNNNVFKQTLSSLNADVSRAAKQQQANERRHQGRGTFQRQLGRDEWIRKQLTPTVIRLGSEEFPRQMQTELDRFHNLAHAVSRGDLQLTPKQIIATANKFAEFQDFARQNNVLLPADQERNLQNFLGQSKESALRQQTGTSPARTTSHPASPSSASQSSPRPSIATASTTSHPASPSSTSQSSPRPSIATVSSAASSTTTLNSAKTDSSRKSTAHRFGSWLKRQSEKLGQQNSSPQAPMSAADIAQRDEIERARWAEHNKNMEGVTIITMEEAEKQHRNTEFNPHARTGKGRR